MLLCRSFVARTKCVEVEKLITNDVYKQIFVKDIKIFLQ